MAKVDLDKLYKEKKWTGWMAAVLVASTIFKVVKSLVVGQPMFEAIVAGSLAAVALLIFFLKGHQIEREETARIERRRQKRQKKNAPSRPKTVDWNEEVIDESLWLDDEPPRTTTAAANVADDDEFDGLDKFGPVAARGSYEPDGIPRYAKGEEPRPMISGVPKAMLIGAVSLGLLWAVGYALVNGHKLFDGPPPPLAEWDEVELECSALAGVKLTRYLTTLAKDRFGKKLEGDAAALMVELAGDSLGLLEQELDKLASYSGDAAAITGEDVRAVVGGWKTETTWAMLDAVRDGDVARALRLFGELHESGEAPQKTLGGLTFSYRKLCRAVELSRLGKPLPAALKEAGVYYRDSDAYISYLKRVTRPRAELFLLELRRTDAGLKGESPLEERTQVERLLIALS